MKVLHIINNLRREGAQVVVRNLVISSLNSDIEHVVYAREPGGSIQAELEARGVSVYVPEKYYGTLDSSRSLAFIAEVIENEGIDLIHAHMPDSACLGWLAARKKSLTMIITYHGHNILLNCNLVCRLVYFTLLWFACRYAVANIAVSTSVAASMHRWLRLPASTIDVITNGVPVPSDEKLKQRPVRKKTSTEHFNIVCVGRLVALKGHHQLIDAASVLIKQYPDMRFYFLGDGPLREVLQEQVVSLNLIDSVIFAGCVDNVSDYLENADVYVTTSETEGLPVATLEAMAWGVPVVASDIAGNRAVVSHGQSGLLYPLNDIKALAGAIKEIVDDRDAAIRRAQRARDQVNLHYSDDATAQSYNTIYHRLERGAEV